MVSFVAPSLYSLKKLRTFTLLKQEYSSYLCNLNPLHEFF